MKHWKIIIAASAIAFVVNFSFAGVVKMGIPKGWSAKGSIATLYETGVDEGKGALGKPALFINSKNAGKDDFGAITQMLDAAPYRSKYMSLSASILHAGDVAGYEIWIRWIKSKDNSSVTSSWGTVSPDWRDLAVKLTVPENAQKIEIGIGIRGQGKLMVKDIKLEEAVPIKIVAVPQVKQLAQRISDDAEPAPLKNLNFNE